MFTAVFWVASFERAVKTFAQSLVAVGLAGALAEQTGLVGVDWTSALSVAGLAALVSVLTSVGTGVVTDGNPSAGSVERLDPKH